MTKTTSVMFLIAIVMLTVLLLTACNRIQQLQSKTEVLKEMFVKLYIKVIPNTIKCPKCNGIEITERNDNPKSLPWTKTMDEIASSSKTWIISTETLEIKFYTYYLTCDTCGYQVKYERSY